MGTQEKKKDKCGINHARGQGKLLSFFVQDGPDRREVASVQLELEGLTRRGDAGDLPEEVPRVLDALGDDTGLLVLREPLAVRVLGHLGPDHRSFFEGLAHGACRSLFDVPAAARQSTQFAASVGGSTFALECQLLG